MEHNRKQPSLIEIPIDEIDLGEHPFRNPQFAKEEELVNSIEDIGVIIPIAVRRIDSVGEPGQEQERGQEHKQ